MANIQNQDARKLLDIISTSVENGTSLTYWEAAKLMGRLPPQDHARAIAQMCDLLDAAACLAGIPLLALVAVREKSGKINPKAWKKESEPRRSAIINRSLNHKFQSKDYFAISNAIDDLGERGNIKAWKYVQGLYPGDLLYRRLIEAYVDTNTDAVDDLGADTPDRAKLVVWSYARDPKVRAAALRRANGACEYCGELGFIKSDGTRYLETHHIIALARDGADRKTNVIALCPNDHRKAHFGEDCEELESKMILKLNAINC